MRSFLKRIRKKRVKSTTYFYIVIPAWLSTTKKRRWFYSRNKADVEEMATRLNAAVYQRETASVLSNAQMDDARRAFELLHDLGLDGVSLRQTVERAAPFFARPELTIGDFFADFSQAKEETWSAASKKNFRFAARLFCEVFSAEDQVSSVDAEALNSWLKERFPDPGYRSNIIRTLRPAFNWGVKHGSIAQSPFARVDAVRKVRDAVDVLTPQEARRAMACCPEDCRAAVALLLFGGVRPAEVGRLKWGDVRDDFIHLRPGITKTAQVRNVEMNETLRAWLAVCERGHDAALVIPANWRRKYQAWRGDAQIANRMDVLRHSYATYHLAAYRDETALRANLGHSASSDVLFRHYRAAATPQQAKAFWAILPS